MRPDRTMALKFHVCAHITVLSAASVTGKRGREECREKRKEARGEIEIGRWEEGGTKEYTEEEMLPEFTKSLHLKKKKSNSIQRTGQWDKKIPPSSIYRKNWTRGQHNWQHSSNPTFYFKPSKSPAHSELRSSHLSVDLHHVTFSYSAQESPF